MRKTIGAAQRTLCAALLAAVLTAFAAPAAEATLLPSSPFLIADTGGGFLALYPFGGTPQTQFAAISPGQLNFTLDFSSIADPSLLDSAFIEVRMDIGVQGNTQYVNVVGPVSSGTDDEGLLVGGTLSLFDITQWAFATDGTPIALSLFVELPQGVEGSLSVDFVASTVAVPEPGVLPLFAASLGALVLLGWRRQRKVAPISHAL